MSDAEDVYDVPVFEDEEHEAQRAFDEVEMETEIARFVDEPPIEHDVYPENQSEEDEEEGLDRRCDMQVFGSEDSSLYKGQVLTSREVFGQSVLQHALKTGRNIKQYRYDKGKNGYKCAASPCNWRVYCARVPMRDQWEVKVFVDNHSCIPNGECEMLKVHVIARLFMEKLRLEPQYYLPMKIQELIKERWNFIVTRGQCQAARRTALKWIEDEYERQFQRLRDYAAELLISNPGSSVAVETMVNDAGLDVFDRLYICFDNVRRTWKETCRPLLGIDGCFLRSNLKGMLLTAIGRDANNAIYLVAWPVVQVEDKPNWMWFLQKLKTDLGLVSEGEGYVLVSDRQKGLIRAVELVLPRIEHRNCVRHIYSNLKKRHGDKPELRRMVWRLAWSYNEVEYQANLQRILAYDVGVWKDVIDTDPMTWCRAFYRVGSYCEDVENNSTESFNGTILRARYKPLIPMLELLSRQAMARICTRCSMASEHEGTVTPYATKALKKEFTRVGECRVTSGTNYMNVVVLDGCTFQVCLGTRRCSCRRWEIRGIPCVQAYAVIQEKQFCVENFVSHYLRTDMWRKNYTDCPVPGRGAFFWPNGGGAPIHRPHSPPQPGRKKKSKKQKRKKGLNESPTKKKKKRIMHCGVCGSANHNSRYHKKRGESTQAETKTSQALVLQ